VLENFAVLFRWPAGSLWRLLPLAWFGSSNEIISLVYKILLLHSLLLLSRYLTCDRPLADMSWTCLLFDLQLAKGRRLHPRASYIPAPSHHFCSRCYILCEVACSFCKHVCHCIVFRHCVPGNVCDSWIYNSARALFVLWDVCEMPYSHAAAGVLDANVSTHNGCRPRTDCCHIFRTQVRWPCQDIVRLYFAWVTLRNRSVANERLDKVRSNWKSMIRNVFLIPGYLSHHMPLCSCDMSANEFWRR
jgi:hypothetical protein